MTTTMTAAAATDAVLPAVEVLDEAIIADFEEALGADVIADLLVKFADNLASYRDQLTAAADAADMPAVRKIAHAMKGLCMQFGAKAAAESARGIELGAATPAEVHSRGPALSAAVAATLTALAERKRRGAGRP